MRELHDVEIPQVSGGYIVPLGVAASLTIPFGLGTQWAYDHASLESILGWTAGINGILGALVGSTVFQDFGGGFAGFVAGAFLGTEMGYLGYLTGDYFTVHTKRRGKAQ